MKKRSVLRGLPITILLTSLHVSALPVFPQSSPALTAPVNASPTRDTQSQTASIQPKWNGDLDEVVRVDTNLVTVPVSVMDRIGRYITDLRKEDFQIFEDEAEQEVAVFTPVEQPFTILFLLDVSSSMIPYKENLGRAANALASRLRPDDQVIAASFYQWVDVLLPPTKVGEMRKDINLKVRQDADCPTLLYDAVDDSLKRMKKVRGRKAIVLFSDGVGTARFATAQGTLHEAEEQDALIYTVQFGSFPAEPPSYVNRKEYFRRLEEINGYMRDLARKTGGRHYRIENLADLDKTFGLVADELRRQYSLGYYPKKRAGVSPTRKIRVKVRARHDVAVQARESYFIK